MKVVGLVSGGKDSCYAMMKCIEYGHEIVALANLLPLEDSVDELDSYMYQTVGHQIVVSYAECMGLPLFRRRIQGSTRHQKLSYRMTLGDEVEDMLILLSEVKRQIPSISAVSSGAIASDYQRLRVESVCSRLGLVSLAYLWKQDQSMLLQEMISNKIVAVLVKVAAIGLDPAKHVGKELMSLQQHLLQLKERYGSNVCGEGGEYETLTLDCPLFINARIVLDSFKVVLHSPDTIAPVGVLHPSSFHLEHKNEATLASHEIGSVYEVHGDAVLPDKANCESDISVSESVLSTNTNIQISKTKHKDTFSWCFWISDSAEASEGLQKDLSSILRRIESELTKDGFHWVNVLYIHLYIADMNEFLLANETYISFITEEKCPLGVPSRSTIELPLPVVGLGKAYVEVLVANDQSKQVLHVQSISSWAPSCIGPYSQATFHKRILYMAGQLGLDPPTMKLCQGGAIAEAEQSLKNCDAVATHFKCSSLSSSTILFTVYCSASLTHSQKIEMQSKIDASIDQNPNPMILYILAPDLPKSALVEIKPILYIPEDKDSYSDSDTVEHSLGTSFSRYWEDFEHVAVTDSCFQQYVVQEKICVMILSITNEQAAKICGADNHGGVYDFSSNEQMKEISKFCIFLLDRNLGENYFSWEDVTSLRFYFPTYLGLSSDTLSLMIADAFEEFAEVSKRIKIGTEPIFNTIPVLGAGSSAVAMNDLITCEIFASKL